MIDTSFDCKLLCEEIDASIIKIGWKMNAGEQVEGIPE